MSRRENRPHLSMRSAPSSLSHFECLELEGYQSVGTTPRPKRTLRHSGFSVCFVPTADSSLAARSIFKLVGKKSGRYDLSQPVWVRQVHAIERAFTGLCLATP